MMPVSDGRLGYFVFQLFLKGTRDPFGSSEFYLIRVCSCEGGGRWTRPLSGLMEVYSAVYLR